MLAYNGPNVCVCKRCGSDKTKVYDSRVRDDEIKQRYRKCLVCGFRWITVEIDRLAWEKLIGEQKDGNNHERHAISHTAG